jgi:hypothetical protein
MMLMKGLYRFFSVCFLFSLFTLYAQNAPQVESLSQLDGETQKTAALIAEKLQSLGGSPRIRQGIFSLEGAESLLGDYWSRQLSIFLASSPNRNYILLDNPPVLGLAAQADYVLGGEILRLGNTLRVYTRLVRQQDNSVAGGWNTDLPLTPFLDELLRAASDSSGVRRDMYEWDSRENPVAVAPGSSWISRTLQTNDEDWFGISGWGSGILILETDGDLDTYMELYEGSSRSALYENDDGGDSNNAYIEYFIDGEKSYTVKVRGYDNDETGSYRFRASIEASAEDSAEPNDTRTAAVSIEPGGRKAASFHSSSDEDWYRISVPAGNIRLILYTEGRVDTKMALYDSGGGLIAEDDDSGNNNNAWISAVPGEGTVFARVTAYDGQRGRYTLVSEIRERIQPDSWENDDTPGTAKEINIGASQERTFSDSEDEDWVRFRITERGIYEIRTRAADTDLDTYIELFDNEENALDENDDGGDHYDAYLRVELNPGNYLLKVRTLNSELPKNGAYTLSITR